MKTRYQPGRKILKSNWSVVGKTASNKTAQLHSFESTLERDFLTLLEFDRSVSDFTEQPVTIPYLFMGKVREYTPDFLVFYDPILSTPPLLTEIKYQADLKQNALLYFPKFQAAKIFCINNGFHFRVITDVDIRNDYLVNCKFLKKYLYIKDIDENDRDLLHTTIKHLRKSTPAELISTCTNHDQRKAELLHLLWHLVAKHEVGCNLKIPITMSTVIWNTNIK